MNSKYKFPLFLLGAMMGFALAASAEAADPIIDEDGWIWDAEIWADYQAHGSQIEKIEARFAIAFELLEKRGAISKDFTALMTKSLREAIQRAMAIGQAEGVTEAANYIENECPVATEEDTSHDYDFGKNPFHSAALTY
jgi:hypothetical protein